MPSMRRVRLFGFIVFGFVIYMLYITSSARQSRSPDIYSKTKEALDRNRVGHHPHSPHNEIDIDGDNEDLANRLKEAELAAKDSANLKSPKPEGFNSQDAPVKATVENLEPNKLGTDKNVAGQKKQDVDGGAEALLDEADESEDQDVEQELNSIFKRSPIIIFSKSYCPHSRRAKDILLEKYDIVPAPYVVELDQHPLGAQLQAKLAEMTGRRTVPNVMVKGKSIGGGDDVAALDESKRLIETIRSYGGRQMQKVQQKSA